MTNTTNGTGNIRLPVLDGWRGISILLVLACHLLPLSPKSWQLNSMAGSMGMALFFTLSGFLITRFLLERPNVGDFLIRRFCRIIPLAWVAITVALIMEESPSTKFLPNFLFYANLPPVELTNVGSHFWSLCLEMQFYLGVALLVVIFGKRGLYLTSLFCIAVTLHRIDYGAYVNIVTWRRADEVLAGVMLALVYANTPIKTGRHLASIYVVILFALLAIASHPLSGGVNYVRPYIAALTVGASLYVKPSSALTAIMGGRILGYIATVSYALYIIHHLLMFTWLGSGEKVIKYLKRPLLFVATFALAHISTFYFERRFINLGKKWSATIVRRPTVSYYGRDLCHGDSRNRAGRGCEQETAKPRKMV